MFDWYTEIFADKASVSIWCLKSTKVIKTSMQKKKIKLFNRIEENQWKEYPFGGQTDPENLIHRFPCLLILLTCKGERSWLWGWAWIAAGNRALGSNAWRKFRCLTPVFSAWSGYSPLDGMLVPICTPGWREALWESSALPKNTNNDPGQGPNPNHPIWSRAHQPWGHRASSHDGNSNNLII